MSLATTHNSDKLLLAKFKKDFYLCCDEKAISKAQALELLQTLDFIEPNVFDYPKAEYLVSLCLSEDGVSVQQLCRVLCEI